MATMYGLADMACGDRNSTVSITSAKGMLVLSICGALVKTYRFWSGSG